MVSYPAACPAARTPLPASRRPRQSLALRPSVRVTMSRLVPPFASRRCRYAVRAKASHSVPAFAPRHPGSSRRSHSAAPVTPLAPKPRAPSQCSRHDIPARPAARTPPPLSRRPRPGGLRRLARCAPGMPRTPSIWKRPAFLAAFGHSKRSRFVLRHRAWGAAPNPGRGVTPLHPTHSSSSPCPASSSPSTARASSTNGT